MRPLSCSCPFVRLSPRTLDIPNDVVFSLISIHPRVFPANSSLQIVARFDSFRAPDMRPRFYQETYASSILGATDSLGGADSWGKSGL